MVDAINKNESPVLTVISRKNGEIKIKKILYGKEAEKEYKIIKDIHKRRSHESI